MSQEFVIKLNYKIKYETTKPVKIEEVINALKSLDSLLQNAGSVIGELSNVDVLGCQIFVEKIESGSLIEDFAVNVIFGNKQEFDAFTGWLHRTNMRQVLIGAILGGALTYGVVYLTNHNSAVPGIAANHIENSPNSMIINFPPGTLSDEVKTQVNEAVRKHIQNNDEVAKQTLNFFEPLKNDTNGYIKMGDGNDMAEISPQTIRNIPKKYVAKKNNRFEDMNAVVIKLRAADLDNKKTGWAGYLDGNTSRLKIELDPTIEPTVLFGKTEITADITLERDFSKQKNQLIPKRIIIRQIY